MNNTNGADARLKQLRLGDSGLACRPRGHHPSSGAAGHVRPVGVPPPASSPSAQGPCVPRQAPSLRPPPPPHGSPGERCVELPGSLRHRPCVVCAGKSRAGAPLRAPFGESSPPSSPRKGGPHPPTASPPPPRNSAVKRNTQRGISERTLSWGAEGTSGGLLMP